ncbi:BatD family protein [Motilimonas cestriensis]|uniref:BatD family protein n=1 Tax=Motilimonas cestriensis TaxID=2742685 RepID=A0ABS8W2R9_9GAMM|nr:BatD family protein [Motilimonas cestriensis]
MKRAVNKINAFLLLLCGLWSFSSLAAINASVSQNPVYVGEIFTLQVEADESLDPDELSTKALEPYFDVFQPSVSRQKNFINGEFSSSTRWSISLMAKQAGQVLIPPLTVAGQTTLPIKLTVLSENQQPDQQKNQDVFIEASLDQNNIYVGQQIIYTLDLYIGAMLENASLSNPELVQADVVQMGQDAKEVVVKNGMKYQKITRKFAITPNQSGDLTIAGPKLTGELYKTVSQSGYRPRTVRQVLDIQADDIKLTVKDKPAIFTGKQWLVSDEVMLSEELQDNVITLTVGQPVTRTFTLIAANTSEKSLPKLTFDYPNTVRVYPDKDEVSGFIHQGTAFAQRISSHAIIAEQAGELILPEVVIPWWNSQTDQLEYAKVPARKLKVVANSETPEVALPEVTPSPTTVVNDAGFWPYLTLLFAIAWFITLLLYLRKPSYPVAKNDITKTASSDPYKQLLAAAKANNSQAAWQGLVEWSNSQWPEIKSVSQIPVSTELQLAIKELQQAIAKGEAWQGASLSKALGAQRKSPTPTNTLGPINPV